MKTRFPALPVRGLILLGALAAALIIAPAHIIRAAGPLVVDTTSDGYIGGVCTLREAIDTVNAQSDQGNDCGNPSASTPANTITFSLPDDSTITLTHNSGQNLVITHAVTIGESEFGGLTIAGSGANRVFLISVGSTAAPVTFEYLIISGGNVGNKPGGGVLIQNQSAVTFNNVSIQTSKSDDNGGGVYIESGSSLDMVESGTSNGNSNSGNQANYGGGIYNAGTLTLTNSDIFNNVANLGGGVYNVGTMTADSESSLWYNNVNIHGGGIFNAVGGEVTLNGAELGSNSAGIYPNTYGDGGDIYNQGTLTLNPDSEINQGSAYRGNGIFQASGSLTIDAAYFNINRASSGDGGAIFLDDATSVKITNSLFDQNETYNGYNGGAIYADNAVNAYVANTTFTNGHADAAGTGSSFYWASTGTLTLNNITIYNNVDNSGASLYAVSGLVNISNSIIDDCDGNEAAFNHHSSYNLFRSATACANLMSEDDHNLFIDDVSTVLDPQLDQHSDEDGVQSNFALIPGSPAIDAGNPATPLGNAPACESDDARGVSRPQGVACDIGAFELEVNPSSGGGGSSHHDDHNTETTPNYATGECASLSGGGFTFSGSGNVDCRVINDGGVFKADAAEIGNMDVLNRGVLQAVDLFSFDNSGHSVTTFDSPVTICLQGSGQFLFINAATTPRTVEGPASYTQNGYTCAQIPNAGIAVLVPGAAAPASTAATTSESTPAAGETALSNCAVTTLYRVNLHEGPSLNSAVIATIPFGADYQATARTADGWIKLIWSNTQGYVRADLLTTSGTCGS